MARPTGSDEQHPPRWAEAVGRRELVWLAIVLLVGTLLRIVAVIRSAIEHFDEGVYASNVFFPPPELAYPMQRYFGPPLLPTLIEASLACGMLIGAQANRAALLPGLLAGCATIAALWWLGRSWFGTRVGLAAAAMCAVSFFHVAYSASALTDVLIVLWMVLAIDAAARSLAQDDVRWAIGAGLFTGLAWWTKYNGWLPLAIEGAGLALLWCLGWKSAAVSHGSVVRPRESDKRTKAHRTQPAEVGDHPRWSSWLSCYVVTCGVAAAVWSPFWLSLQSQGGYGPIAANHAKYLVGFSGWLNSAARHIASFAVMDEGWTTVALVVAAVVAALASVSWSDLNGRGFLRRLGGCCCAAAIGAGLSWLAGGLLSLAVLSSAGLLTRFTRLASAPSPNSATSRARVGFALLTAWWCGLLVATPCYWPYPRLLMPWLAAAWLGVGLFIDEFLAGWLDESDQLIAPSSTDASHRRRVLSGATAIALLVAGALARFGGLTAVRQVPLATDRRAIQRVAEQMRADLDSRQSSADSAATNTVRRVVYVLGEPALFLQLSAAGESVVRPVQQIAKSPATFAGQPLPTFIALGPHAEREPDFAALWQIAEPHLTLVAAYRFTPSPIVWLDSHDPRPSFTGETNADDEIRVYEVRQE